MEIQLLLNKIGDDADLLTYSDMWLERERQFIAAEMEDLLQQLRVVTLAQHIKAKLQQTNLVAFQNVKKTPNDLIKTVEVCVTDARNAVNVLKNGVDVDQHSLAQICMMRDDGYDVDA